MNNPDHISESLEKYFWIKIHIFIDVDPGWKNSDPGRKKFGSRINISDPQHFITVHRYQRS
jgi:hypothetical protein